MNWNGRAPSDTQDAGRVEQEHEAGRVGAVMGGQELTCELEAICGLGQRDSWVARFNVEFAESRNATDCGSGPEGFQWISERGSVDRSLKMVKIRTAEPVAPTSTCKINRLARNGFLHTTGMEDPTFWEQRGYAPAGFCASYQPVAGGKDPRDVAAPTGCWTADRPYNFVILKAGRIDWMYKDVTAGQQLCTSDCNAIDSYILCAPPLLTPAAVVPIAPPCKCEDRTVSKDVPWSLKTTIGVPCRKQ